MVEHRLGFLINDGRNFFLSDSMEMNEKIYRGMGEFAEFLYKLNRVPQKIDPASVFYYKAAGENRSDLRQMEICHGLQRSGSKLKESHRR